MFFSTPHYLGRSLREIWYFFFLSGVSAAMNPFLNFPGSARSFRSDYSRLTHPSSPSSFSLPMRWHELCFVRDGMPLPLFFVVWILFFTLGAITLFRAVGVR